MNFGQNNNGSANNFGSNFGGASQQFGGGIQQSQPPASTFPQSTGFMNSTQNNQGFGGSGTGFMGQNQQNSTQKKMSKRKSVSKQPQEQNYQNNGNKPQQKQQGFVPGAQGGGFFNNQQTYIERNPSSNPQISNFQPQGGSGFPPGKKSKSKTLMGQGGQQPAAPIAPSGGSSGFMQPSQGGNKASIIGQMNQPKQLNKIRDFSNNSKGNNSGAPQTAAAPQGGMGSASGGGFFSGGFGGTNSGGFGAAENATATGGFGGAANNPVSGFASMSQGNGGGFGNQNGKQSGFGNKQGGFEKQNSNGQDSQSAAGGLMGKQNGFQSQSNGFQNAGGPQGGGFMGNNSTSRGNDRGRGKNGDRGRGNSERGRGNQDRGRGNSDRGRGASDRGRGRGMRGNVDQGTNSFSHGGSKGRGYSDEPNNFPNKQSYSPDEGTKWNPHDQSGETFQSVPSNKNLPKFLQNKNPQKEEPPKQQKKDIQDDGYDDEEDNGDQDYDEEYGEEQLQELPENTKKPCRFNMMGTCQKSAEQCIFLHFDCPPISEEHCKFFASGNQCKFDENTCKLRHDPEYQMSWTKKMLQAMQIHMTKQQMQKDFKQQNRPIKEPETEDINNKNKSKNLNALINTWDNKPNEEEQWPQHQSQPKQKQITAPAHQKQFVPPAVLEHKASPVDSSFYCNSPAIVVSRIQKLLTKLQKIQQNSGQFLIPNKAHCLMMCPQEHKDDEQLEKSHFELDQRGQQFDLMAIKKYMKSDASKRMDNPEIMRPPIVLYITMKFMRDCIIDQDLILPGQSFFQYQNQAFGEIKDLSVASHSFLNIYSFLMDRTRQISQDFSIISQQPSKYSVRCYEQIIRYLIILQHDGLSEIEFQFYTNLKKMTGCMGDLRQKQYQFIRRSKTLTDQEKQQLLTNEVEMLAYQIIASSEDFFELQKLLKDMNRYQYSADDKKLLQEAIKISSTIQSNDYARFFSIFKNTNYMFSCLMLNFFERIRRHAINEFSGRNVFYKDIISGQFIMNALLLPDKTDCFNCIRAYGFNPDENTCSFDPKVRSDSNTWTVEIQKFRQQKLTILNEKRNLGKDRLRRDFIKYGLRFVLGDKPIISKPKPIVDPEEEKRKIEIKRLEAEKKLQETQAAEQAKQMQIRLQQEAELLQKEKEKQEDLKRTQKFQNCFRKFAEKIQRGQSKKLRHYAKQIRNHVEQLRYEHELLIQKELEKAARLIRKQKQQKQKVIFETILRQNLDETRKIEKQKEIQFVDESLPKNIFKQQKVILADFQDLINPFEINDKDQFKISKYNFKYQKQKTFMQKLEEKVPENEKLVINLMMEKTGQILEKTVRNIFSSEQENVVVKYSSNIVEDIISSLRNRGFSILTLVINQPGLSFNELAELASYLSKKSKNMEGAQITLMIIAVNIPSSKIEKLFEKTLQNKFIGCLKVIELRIPTETLVIEDLVKLQLNSVDLSDLKFETISDDPEFKDFTLDHVFNYHCMNFRQNLKNQGSGVIQQFNHCLATFKFITQNLLENAGYEIAKNEFHQYGGSSEFTLRTQKSIDLLTNLASIELIPVGNQEITKDYHIQFVLDHYLKNVKIQYDKQSGSELFAQFFDQITNQMKDLNLLVLNQKMMPLYPFKIENIKVNSQTQNLVINELKKQFPRDFKAQILGKRVDYSRNFIEPQVIQKPKKRQVKAEVKFCEPEPEEATQVQSPVFIDLDSDNEDPLAFALRIQKQLHNSQETNENSFIEFDLESFSNLVNEINVKMQ